MIWDTYYSDGSVPTYPTRVGSFWWRDAFKLSDTYRVVASAKVNMGDSVMFGLDAWQVGGPTIPLFRRLPRFFPLSRMIKLLLLKSLAPQIFYLCSTCLYLKRLLRI